MGRRTKTRRVGEQKGTKALTLSRTTGACTLLIEVKVIDCVRSILVFAYVLQVAAPVLVVALSTSTMKVQKVMNGARCCQGPDCLQR